MTCAECGTRQIGSHPAIAGRNGNVCRPCDGHSGFVPVSSAPQVERRYPIPEYKGGART